MFYDIIYFDHNYVDKEELYGEIQQSHQHSGNITVDDSFVAIFIEARMRLPHSCCFGIHHYYSGRSSDIPSCVMLWKPELKSSASNCSHLTKFFLLVFDIFSTTSDSFLFHLWEAEVSTLRLTTLPPPVFIFWLASLKGIHQKVVKKMSQSCQKLIENFVGCTWLDALDCKFSPDGTLSL